MGYTFKSLCIRNFKYITNNKPLKFDFMNSNIVILDGQNGYGKTTLFDAIEVLVTGKIKHFNEYSCAVTPQVRQTGNRLSGLAGTAYASLLA